MRVLMASKALVVGAYHAKLESLGAQPEIELLALAPDSWWKRCGLTASPTPFICR